MLFIHLGVDGCAWSVLYLGRCEDLVICHHPTSCAGSRGTRILRLRMILWLSCWRCAPTVMPNPEAVVQGWAGKHIAQAKDNVRRHWRECLSCRIYFFVVSHKCQCQYNITVHLPFSNKTGVGQLAQNETDCLQVACHVSIVSNIFTVIHDIPIEYHSLVG